jgi:hypothetical protein
MQFAEDILPAHQFALGVIRKVGEEDEVVLDQDVDQIFKNTEQIALVLIPEENVSMISPISLAGQSRCRV